MATKITKQVKAQLINEVARSYKDKIKRLTDKNTQLSKSNWDLIQKNGILNEKIQELEERLSQYEDWNRRLQEFMDMEPDEREKAIQANKTQEAFNIKIEPYINLMSKLFM